MEEGNVLADREAKDTAKDEVPSEMVKSALIPDGKISIEGKPVYNNEIKNLSRKSKQLTTRRGGL